MGCIISEITNIINESYDKKESKNNRMNEFRPKPINTNLSKYTSVAKSIFAYKKKNMPIIVLLL